MTNRATRARAAGPAATSASTGPEGPRPGRPAAPVAAITGLFLLALLGVWLVAAPFALGDQPRGGAWTAATTTDVATGAALSVLALLGYLAASIAWLSRFGR